MTENLPSIQKVEVVGPFRLRLRFNDGRDGEWGFERLAAGDRMVTAAFKEPGFFDRVSLDFGALTWPNGYDLSPVALYDEMLAAGALSHKPAAAG